MIRRLQLAGVIMLLLLLFTGSPSSGQTADFMASDTTGCAPLVVNFADNSSGTISSYSWNLGNASSSTLQNPSTTYTSPGSYTVRLTVTGPGGSHTLAKTAYITVYDKPAISFTASGPVAGCTPHSTQFSSTVTANSPGPVTYLWDFGDGYSATGSNPSHTYVTPGTYPVSVVVTNGAGCVNTVQRTAYITAYDVPVGGFSVNQTSFCSIPAVANFTASTVGGTTPYTTSWTFGDGGTGGGSTVSHTYSAAGGFTVTMRVSDAHGCTDTVIAPGYIAVNTTVPTFSAKDSVCVDAALSFINTTPGAAGAFWDFDDGSTSTGSQVFHVFLSSGTYAVKMTTDIAGCTKTAFKTVTVNPKPIPTITMSPSIPCPAPVTVTFSGSSLSAAVATYKWVWTSGTALGQAISKNYQLTDSGYQQDTVKLITTSAFGCTDSVVMDTVMIRDIIVDAGASPFEGCAPLDVTFGVGLRTHLPKPPLPNKTRPYLLPAISWSWDFGDGSPTSTSNLPTPTHRYLDTGVNYIVRAIITTPNGCLDTGYGAVHTDSTVTPSFTISPLQVCTNTPVTLINTTAKQLTGTTFQWIFYNGSILDSVINKRDTGRVIAGFPGPGTYSVYLASHHGGCSDSVWQHGAFVVKPPGAKFIEKIHCSPSRMVDFTNTSISATSQLWFFGDGSTSTLNSPSHNYTTTGTYTVTLVAYNSSSGCIDTFRKAITVFDPMIDFVASDTAVCSNSLVEFTAAFTGPGAVMYSWVFGTNQTQYDTVNKMYFTYLSKGFHDVALITVTGNNCFDTLLKRNYILVSRPAVNFGAYPPIGCEPLVVLFRDSTTNTPGVRDTIRSWNFGDGSTLVTSGTVNTAAHTYYVNGNYSVVLIVTDSLQCSDTLNRSHFVSIHKPEALATISDDSVCRLAPVLFISTSSAAARPLRHHWDFGDGNTDTARIATHRYANRGSYAVRLIVTDTVGCSDTLVFVDSIRVDAPHAAFTMSDSVAICPPLQITFSNQSLNAVSYLWKFGTSGSSIATNPVTTFNASGLYPISLVATNVNGCTDTAKAFVRVLGYSGAFSYTPLAGCVPMTVVFSTPITGVPSIIWDFGDGNLSTTTTNSTSHTYLTPGPYLPKVIFLGGPSCTSSSLGLDTIKVDQVNAAFGWSVPCVGTSFTLTDSSTALYTAPGRSTWYFGSSDTAAGSPVSYTFAIPGNHPVTLVAGNATGCRDTITRDVFINPLPEIRASDDTSVCPNDKISLLATGGASYTWSPAPDSMNNCPVCDIAFVHLDSAAGGTFRIFTVTGTDGNGCVNKDSVRVRLQLRTEYSTGVGGDICVGESFRLHAEGAHKYEWLPAATLDSPFIASPLATPERTTTYIVAAREGSCDIDSQSVTVVVRSRPLFSAGNDEIIALGSAVTLKPTKIGISRIEWSADTTLTCLDCFDPSAHPHYTRTYYATGYNEFGCPATDSVTVHVRCNGSLVFIPNTFTPNGDGLNDYFFPRGEGIERMGVFRVYNRWGELVFERSNAVLNDERGGWDGSFKGKSLAPDVYMYTMQSTCSSGDIIEWKGDVTIVR